MDPSYSPPLSVDRHPKKTKTIQSPKSDDHAVDPSYSLALSVSRHPKGTNSKGHHQDFHSSPRKTNSKGFNGAYHFHVQTPRLDEHGKMGETLTLLREYLMKNYSADPDAYGKAAERISSLMEHSEKTKKETRGVKGKHSPQTGVRKTSRPHSSHDLRALRTCSSSERGGRMKHQVPHASVPLPDWDWKKGGRVSSMVSTKEVGGNHKDNRVRNYKNSEPRHGRTMRRKSLCYSELTLESGTHQKSSTEQERRRSMCNSELEKSAADGSAISTPKRLGLGISIDRLDGLERDEPKGHSKGAADEITHTLTRRRCVRSTGRLEGTAFEPRKKGPLSRHKKESQRGSTGRTVSYSDASETHDGNESCNRFRFERRSSLSHLAGLEKDSKVHPTRGGRDAKSGNPKTKTRRPLSLSRLELRRNGSSGEDNMAAKPVGKPLQKSTVTSHRARTTRSTHRDNMGSKRLGDKSHHHPVKMCPKDPNACARKGSPMSLTPVREKYSATKPRPAMVQCSLFDGDSGNDESNNGHEFCVEPTDKSHPQSLSSRDKGLSRVIKPNRQRPKLLSKSTSFDAGHPHLTSNRQRSLRSLCTTCSSHETTARTAQRPGVTRSRSQEFLPFKSHCHWSAMITVPIVGEIPKELQDKIKEKARQKEKQKQKQEKQEDHKFKYDGHFSDLEDSDLED